MTFLNVTEIESALVALNATYPSITQLIPLPNETAEHRFSNALLIRGNPGFDCRPALVFISGVHAREWGGPDILVNLATDLLEAYTTNAGLAYGGKTFSAGDDQIDRRSNGRHRIPGPEPRRPGVQHGGARRLHQAMWRKNRNPASSGGIAARIGVDINRNYDFLWNFPVTFAPGVGPASRNPV